MSDSEPLLTQADRNLLFGVLALQMDFVSREQLIAAVSAWIVDKTRPLEAYLQEQKAIANDERQLLAALVRKHLEKHSNDAGQSLAAISSIGSLHDVLKQLDDPDLHATLEHFGITQSASDDPYRTEPAATPLGERFRILRPHATGGLGRVSVARDEELNRDVALKELHAAHTHKRDYRSRFLLEAEITGALEHPGIVPIYGLGQFGDGRPFYAMRFIKGESLQEAIHQFHQTSYDDVGERALALRKLIGRFIDVCQAVAYAHSRGVLHRDLKPGNIMLGKYGETLVVDWGLAKAVGHREQHSRSDESTLKPGSGTAPTLVGAAIGTPAYMSPEQASGKLDELRETTDVYGLGATLYCLLTGEPPHSRPDIGATLAAARNGILTPPRELKDWIPPQLEAISLRALAHAPERRYSSPTALADDLERWLSDEPPHVYREGLSERLGRLSRKHKTATQVMATAALLITLVSVAAVFLIDRQRRRAEGLAKANENLTKEEKHARKQVESQRDEARRLLEMSEARRLTADSVAALKQRPQRALLLAAEAVKASRASRDRPLPIAVQALYDAYSVVGGDPLGIPTDDVRAAAITEDKASLITVCSDGTARIWDLTAEPRIEREFLVGEGQITDRDDESEYATYGSPRVLSAFSSDKRWLATRDLKESRWEEKLALWDLSDSPPRQFSLFMKHNTRSGNSIERRVTFSPDSRWLFASTFEEVFAWDLRSEAPGDARYTIRLSGVDVESFAVSPDSTWLAVGGEGELRLIELAQQSRAVDIILDDSSSYLAALSLGFDSSSSWVVAGYDDGKVRSWRINDLTTPVKSPSWVVDSGCSNVRSIAISPDNDFMIACDEQTLSIIEPDSADLFSATPPRSRVAVRSDDWMNKLCISPDGARLSAIGGGGVTHLWRIQRDNPDIELTREGTLRGHDGELTTAAFTSSARHIVAIAGWQCPRAWYLHPDGERLPDFAQFRHALTFHATSRIAQLAVSRDSKLVATLADRPEARIWDLQQSRRPPSVIPLDGVATRLAYSATGDWLAIEEQHGKLRLRRQSGSEIVLSGESESTSELIFSSDSRWLATLDSQRGMSNREATRKAQIWDLDAADPHRSVRLLAEEKGGIDCAAFVGRSIMTAGNVVDAGVGFELWKLTDELPELRFAQPGKWSTHRGFTAKSRWFLGHLDGQRTHIFDLSLGLLKSKLRTENGIAAKGTFAMSKPLLFDARSSFKAFDITSGVLTEHSFPESFSPALYSPADYSPAAAVSRDGRWAAIGGESGQVGIWQLAGKTGQQARLFQCSDRSVSGVGFSLDGSVLATSDWGATIRLWDLSQADGTTAPFLQIGDCGHVADELVLAADCKWLIATSDSGPTSVWTIDKESREATQVAFSRSAVTNGWPLSPNDEWLVTSGEDPTGSMLWDLKSGDPHGEGRRLARGHLRAISFSTNARWLAGAVGVPSGTNDKPTTLYVWDLSSRDLLRSNLEELSGRDVLALQFSPSGNRLAAVCADSTYMVWERLDDVWHVCHEVPCGKHKSFVADLSADLLWLSLSFTEPSVRCVTRWQLDGSEMSAQRMFLDDWATLGAAPKDNGLFDRKPLAFSPNGRWLITDSGAGEFYDLVEKVRRFARTTLSQDKGHFRDFREVQFSPDSQWLLASTWDGTWLLFVPGHAHDETSMHLSGSIRGQAISPNCQKIVTIETEFGFDESTVRIADVVSPDDPVKLKTGRVADCVFSKDSEYLYTASADRITRWDLNVERLVERAKEVAGRRLNAEERRLHAVKSDWSR